MSDSLKQQTQQKINTTNDQISQIDYKLGLNISEGERSGLTVSRAEFSTQLTQLNVELTALS